ncbi:MAG: hypothetical protein K5912_02940 [Alphaproteobacteria bacterium]|nr:hypothetical protein [Alphaproteobacteria bacterium]
MIENNNHVVVNSMYEMYVALCNLTKSDFGIKCRFDANINLEYRAACCYYLSCGYFITDIGIFDTHRKKVSVDEEYEDSLFRLAKQRFDKFGRKTLTKKESR